MDTLPICGFRLLPGQFSAQDWESINGIDASGRLISKLLKPIFYLTLGGRLLEIPPFQPTDYASAPGALWGPPLFIIPYGWWSLSAAGHDSGFQNLLMELFADGTKALANLSEAVCNDLILEMMNAVKPNPTPFEILQRDAIYRGVSLLGWHAYKADRS